MTTTTVANVANGYDKPLPFGEVELHHTKTYKTRANARRAIAEVLDVDLGDRCTIIPVEINGSIRYAPIVFYGGKSQPITYAYAGFMVV